MSPEALYILWSVLLVIGLVAAWVTNVFSLPGNWLMVGLTALFTVFYTEGVDQPGISWIVVIVLGVLAAIGEILELVTGAAGAARKGADRRTRVLAVLGAIVGSIVGAVVGSPIPIVGSLIAAVLGAALGSFGGAYLGATWEGKKSADAFEVSAAAFYGRLLGTIAKIVIGGVMIVIATAAVIL